MRVFRFLCLAVIGMAFVGCSLLGGDSEPKYRLTDLQGLWLENNTEHYVRFTTEKSDEEGYLYGREWDEADDVFEEDLLQYGNGWFKYKFEVVDGKLTEIHLMDNGGAEIPKIYVVTKLTDTELEYYEKSYQGITYKFAKVVVSKD